MASRLLVRTRRTRTSAACEITLFNPSLNAGTIKPAFRLGLMVYLRQAVPWDARERIAGHKPHIPRYVLPGC
jgi:hypothetical protein